MFSLLQVVVNFVVCFNAYPMKQANPNIPICEIISLFKHVSLILSLFDCTSIGSRMYVKLIFFYSFLFISFSLPIQKYAVYKGMSNIEVKILSSVECSIFRILVLWHCFILILHDDFILSVFIDTV